MWKAIDQCSGLIVVTVWQEKYSVFNILYDGTLFCSFLSELSL